jgi:hypothetical protein
MRCSLHHQWCKTPMRLAQKTRSHNEMTSGQAPIGCMPTAGAGSDDNRIKLPITDPLQRCNRRLDAVISTFFHPDYTVGVGIVDVSTHRTRAGSTLVSGWRRLAGCTPASCESNAQELSPPIGNWSDIKRSPLTLPRRYPIQICENDSKPFRFGQVGCFPVS